MSSTETNGENYQYDLAKEFIIPRIKKIISPRKMLELHEMRLLDIGCGDGGCAVAIAEEGVYDCVGIDTNEGYHEVAKRFASLKGIRVNFFWITFLIQLRLIMFILILYFCVM